GSKVGFGEFRLCGLVGGGGAELRLAHADARDERENGRLRCVRCALHRALESKDRSVNVNRRSPLCHESLTQKCKKPAGPRDIRGTTGFVARPPATAYEPGWPTERTSANG